MCGENLALKMSDHIIESLEESLKSESPDARRVFHGRGGKSAALKHVVIDWYSPALLMTLYADEVINADLLEEVACFAQNTPQVECLLIQRRYLTGAPVERVFGEPPERAHESGLQYHLSLERNQNHGFFPDMKPGRDWVRERSGGQRVLNLFAYTCALSVAAIDGDAKNVVNLDVSSAALSTGRENHRLNFEPDLCRRASYLPHDLFKSWGRLKRLAPFDLVILDPPSHQPGSFVAVKDYPRLLRRLPEILAEKGEILACLNAPELGERFLSDLFAEYIPQATFFECLPQPAGYEEAERDRRLKRSVYHLNL